MTIFFGFGMADNMFPAECVVARRELTPEVAKEMIEQGVVPCLNPSHAATIGVMTATYGIEVPIPPKAPVVKLTAGDQLIVMAVSGLPRLEVRHEYTAEEVAKAQFRFGLWTVSANEAGRDFFGQK